MFALLLALTSVVSPVDGSLLDASPSTVVVDFEDAVVEGSSTATLDGPDALLSLGVGTAVDDDTSAFVVPGSLSDGEWTLRWSATALDGTVIEGISTFVVNAGVPPTETLPPADLLDETYVDGVPEASEAKDGKRDDQVAAALEELAVLGIVVISVAVIMLGGGAWLRRRKSSRWLPGGSYSTSFPDERVEGE